MKTIRFTNESGDLAIDVLTDLIGSNDMLTIYGVVGLEGADESFGFNFKVPGEYTLVELKQFAEDKNLTMKIIEEGESTITSNTYTALSVTTTSLPGGTAAGAAQVETITLPATSAATQGDYVVLSNYEGETLAAWLDIDADGTAPTGVKYTGADYTVKIPIVTDGTAADNGTLFVEAVSSVADWSRFVTVVDGEDGTVEITQKSAGDVADADPENAGSTGAGSISVSVDTDGAGEEYLNDDLTIVEMEYEGGNAPVTWTAESLPAGLSIDSTTGVISGVPTASADTYTVTFTVTDFYDVTDSADIDIVLS